MWCWFLPLDRLTPRAAWYRSGVRQGSPAVNRLPAPSLRSRVAGDAGRRVPRLSPCRLRAPTGREERSRRNQREKNP